MGPARTGRVSPAGGVQGVRPRGRISIGENSKEDLKGEVFLKAKVWQGVCKERGTVTHKSHQTGEGPAIVLEWTEGSERVLGIRLQAVQLGWDLV